MTDPTEPKTARQIATEIAEAIREEYGIVLVDTKAIEEVLSRPFLEHPCPHPDGPSSYTCVLDHVGRRIMATAKTKDAAQELAFALALASPPPNRKPHSPPHLIAQEERPDFGWQIYALPGEDKP